MLRFFKNSIDNVALKDHRLINADYDQDWINGIGKSEYSVLFSKIDSLLLNDRNKKVLDIAGGNGKLALLLSNKYKTFLVDSVLGFIQQAIKNGLLENRSLVSDILKENFTNKIGTFNIVVMKSSMHEFPKKLMPSIHRIIFNAINPGGYYIDWDVHAPNIKTAFWLKSLINVKDRLAGMENLVRDRSFYTEEEIIESLKKTEFKNVEVFKHFFYTVSIQKFAKAYWNSEKNKTSEFYLYAVEAVKTAPDEIKWNLEKEDVVIQIPAVMIIAEKSV